MTKKTHRQRRHQTKPTATKQTTTKRVQPNLLKRSARFNPATVLALAVLAVGFGYVLAFGHAASKPPIASSRFGINSLRIMTGNDSEVSATFDQMKALGVGWARADFEWSGVEPTKGSFDWAKEDVAVDEASAHGINVLATLDYTPAWARTNQTSDHYPPNNPAQFAAFAGKAVKRYKKQVHYWEIWNEPNNPEFWAPKPNAAAYTTLLKATYAAIKSADPTATVISGGLTVSNGNNDAIPFLQAMYAQNGGTSTGLFDAVGWHPYCGTVRPSKSVASWCLWYQMNGSTPSARSIMTAAGDATKQIWPTEYGVCTGGSGGDIAGQSVQAADLADAYGAAGATPWLGPLFWYKLQDTTDDQSQSIFGFCGLLTYAGVQKTGWQTYRSAAAAADTTPPGNVAIFTPVAGSTVSGTDVTLGASATDNIGVTRVSFYLDGALLGDGQVTTYGYGYSWDSTTAANGPHSFFAQAYDAAGNVTLGHAITLNVNNSAPAAK